MSDPGMFIKAGEPERLSGQGGTWRIPLNIEPNVEWRRRFLRTAHADGLFAGRKIAVQCAAMIVELDGAPLSVVRQKIAHWIAQANVNHLGTHCAVTSTGGRDDPGRRRSA
jgi:hypothetical protein